MIVGNLIALAQTSFKRMLAYSSIAHAGYLMVGIAAANGTGWVGIMYYLAAYLFMQLGAFAVVGILERENGGHLSIDDYRGMGRRRPGLAIIMAIFMFSLGTCEQLHDPLCGTGGDVDLLLCNDRSVPGKPLVE